MYKRIMMRSIDELYSFCLENNFVKFDSAETGNELVVEMPGNFQKSDNDADKHREGLTPFVSRAFHDKINLNKSKIETDVFKENLPSSHLRPILANIVTNEETNELDFGSHDFHMETVTELDENGKEVKIEKAVYDEQPIGVIDGTRNKIEYDKEADVNRAVLHGYLYDEYCQDAIDILNRRGTVDCSIELSIRSMSFDGKERVLILDDFYVSALTLLGSNVSPGMAGSNFKIEDFSAENNSVKFDKDEKLIELLETLNKTLSNFNNKEHFSAQDNEKEGGNEGIMFEKLLEKYGKTIEDITFEYESLSDEELEQKFTELFDEENPDNSDGEPSNDGEGEEISEPEGSSDNGENTDKSEDPEENPDDGTYSLNPEKYSITMSDGTVKDFALSLDEITSALHTLVNNMYADDNTWYSVTVYEDGTLIMSDWWNNKYFKQSYTREDDNFSLVGDRVAVHSVWVTDEEEDALNEMRSNYAALKEFKETVEQNELRTQKEKVINSDKYAVLAEKNENGEYVNADFAMLVKEMDNYSLADLETKVKVMHSDFVSEHQTEKMAFSAKPEVKKITSVKLFANPNNEKKTKPSRYGDLFKE